MSVRVFLSAGIPSGDRAQAFEPYSAGAIGDAVVAVALAILRRGGTLTFGGHPLISPLVLRMARTVGRPGAVEIFQSERYRNRVPDETLELEREGWGRIEWVAERSGDNVARALSRMRTAMLVRELRAAVFVGGMDGIELEFRQFREQHPEGATFVLSGPGGAARRLSAAAGAIRVLEGGRYPELAHRIGDELGLPTGR